MQNKTLRIIALVLTLSFMLCSVAPIIVCADSDIDITTTSVRADLASMGEDRLSYVSDINCIFIAMSQYYDPEGNLRSYVYLNLPASVNDYIDDLTISISTSVSDENYNITENYEKYRLRYINSEATWYKYEILDLPNLEYTTRRYHIEEIFVVNQAAYLGFRIDEVYIFNGITNDSIQVFNEEFETITITDKEVAFYCYGDGQNVFFKDTSLLNAKDIYTDAWYIFFNTDKPIDNLYEVELTYTQYDYHFYRTYVGLTLDSAVTEKVIDEMKNYSDVYAGDFESGRSYVNYHNPTISIIEPGTTKVSYTDDKWFGKYDTYYEELDNIMDLRQYHAGFGDDFVFTDYANQYTWGVHFKDTERQLGDWESGVPLGLNLDGSGMSDVAILRLKFKTNGVVHNCYAVDVPTDDFTGNSANVDTKIEEFFEKIMAVLLVILIIVVLSFCFPFVSAVIKILFNGIWFIVKLLFSLVGLPIRLLSWSISRRK